MELKQISREAIPRALELAERYRLLNEPEQAASICDDVLAADPHNKEALHTLFLATTDQFAHMHGPKLEDADAVVARMETDYERAYYGGIARERWARAKLHQGSHSTFVGDWIRRALEKYEQAEGFRPHGNEDAKLRWNACVRLLKRMPGLSEDRENLHDYGD